MSCKQKKKLTSFRHVGYCRTEVTELSAENTRLNDENTRLAKETSRLSSEAARYARISAENIRLNDENARLGAATSRLTRVSAENSRLNEENTRLTEETCRLNLEVERLEKEVSRLQGGCSGGGENATRAVPLEDSNDQIWIGRIRRADIDGLSDSKKQELDDGIRSIMQTEVSATSDSGENVKLLSDNLFNSLGIPIDYFWKGKRSAMVTSANTVPLKFEYLAIFCGYGLDSFDSQNWYNRSIAIYTMLLVGRYRGVIVDQ
jgi:hypothetical protein